MIKNNSKDTTITKNIKFLNSNFEKAKGLMFSTKKKIKDTGLVFVMDKEYRINLHMFFVFFPIDVLFVDEDFKIVEIKENFRPFTFYFPKKASKYVVELPKGAVEKSYTRVEDFIKFDE